MAMLNKQMVMMVIHVHPTQRRPHVGPSARLRRPSP
jgi:hypothetical protein